MNFSVSNEIVQSLVDQILIGKQSLDDTKI